MKNLALLVSAAALAAIVGCASNKSNANAGAVGEKSCSEKATCTDKSTCTDAKADKGSMGAVGEKKAGCCDGAKKTDGSMGAVAPKAECTATKSGCCDAAKKN